MTSLGADRAGVDRPVTLVLAEIAHILAPTDDTEERLRRALELLGEIIAYERCAVVEAIPGGEPRIHLAPDLSPSERHAFEPALLRLFGLVSESAAPRDIPERAGAGSLASYLAVPLVGIAGDSGLLLVSQEPPDAYDEDDLRLLSIVASQIATFLSASRPRAHDARPADERVAPRAGDVRQRVEIVPGSASELTKRQFEVARLIAAGRSNAQIAQELVLTQGTVANHIEHILRRLGANNRAQVAAWVVERELLTYEP